MLRVLHIARATTGAANAKAAAMAREPGLSLSLVRPSGGAGEGLTRLAPFAGVRLVGCWRRSDPHRGLYATLGFGIRAARPHVIHAEEEPDSLAALQLAAARRFAAPSARLILHTWQNVNRPKRPPVRAVLEATLRAADAVLCASETAVSVLRALGFDGSTRVIIPGAGYEPETFHPGPVRTGGSTDCPADDRDFTIGYVGRLVSEKALDTLVAAAAKMGAPRRLEIAGTGPTQAALGEQARSGGIPITFLGRLEAQGVADFLRRVDVLVLPSRTTPVWAEQFGRVLVEAMACGTPVVGSSSGEIPSVIGDAGLVFPEGDDDALARTLTLLRDDPQLRSGCSERGLVRADRLYSPARVAEQTVAFYRELAQHPPRVKR